MRANSLSAQKVAFVGLAECILKLSGSKDPTFTPAPSTTQPLFIMAHSEFPESIRRRAVDLLRRYPRREGLWNTVFAAAPADMSIAHKKSVRRHYDNTGKLCVLVVWRCRGPAGGRRGGARFVRLDIQHAY
ncbi:hypothetical protein DL770_011781 [Monosporascus sp. CRB-9-2]|nr:hypothetical protein DL770_011781 [Monosporascus sp. CRB-9-2]